MKSLILTQISNETAASRALNIFHNKVSVQNLVIEIFIFVSEILFLARERVGVIERK